MRRLSIILMLAATGMYAAVAQMTADQKILHALNRLTFGARAGEVDQVKQRGLDHWIEVQLHPESIEENQVLEAKLQPLDTLRMSTAEMLRRYPNQQMVRAMAEGRMPLPADAETRALVKIAIARYEKKKAADNTQAGDKTQAVESPAPLEPLSLEARRRMENMRAPMQVVERDLSQGRLLRAIYTNRQLEEVLTDFWYNHFNVYLNKGADRSLVTSYERDVIRPHVLGKFKDLLIATAESPAMLFYLDNWQSTNPNAAKAANAPVRPGQKRSAGLNENYGRELMELHTLGVDGGYTQKDVTEVARCFTGWTIRQPRLGGEFQFNARMHDTGEKQVLGVTIAAGGGMEDGLKVLDILAHHPSTAHFISQSLAMRFVSDDPPATLVNKMSKTFLASDGDLRAVVKTMVEAPEFWDPANFRSKVKSPLEMVAGAVRAVNGDVITALPMAILMNQLGEPLYRKQEPTGYSNRSAEWMNSASLLARMNFATSLAQGQFRGVRVDPAQFGCDTQQHESEQCDAREIERKILFTEASPQAQAAIKAGLSDAPGHPGALIAGLTLGSPDFQRR